MPRATSLTDELIELAHSMLVTGADQRTVFESIGIPEGTWYSWMKKGNALLANGMSAEDDGITESERLYMSFAEGATRAKARGRMLLIRDLRKSIEGDWRGILEVLARRAPNEWGRHRVLQPGTDGADPVRIYIPDNGKVVYSGSGGE